MNPERPDDPGADPQRPAAPTPGQPPPSNPLPERGPDGLLAEDFRFTAPAVTLPKGGGAIAGMGEKFQANPVTASANTTLPLPLSPGRGGVTPALSLSYDSGASNGPFGLGWQLAVPSVRRKTSKGLPRYLDDGEHADTYLMSDAEDLVPFLEGPGGGWQTVERTVTEAGTAYSVKRYRPRTEGGFARIERWTRDSDGDIHWRSTTRSNVHRVYGRSATARSVDPADGTRIYEWFLEEERGELGNIIAYHYATDTEADTTGHPAEARRAPTFTYLERVSYSNTDMGQNPSAGGTGRFLFHLVFDYGGLDPADPDLSAAVSTWDLRSDPYSTFRPGFDLRCRRLCTRVLMFHSFTELREVSPGVPRPVVVRSLELTHTPRPTVSTLDSARIKGWRWTGSAYEHELMPPVSMTYIEPAIGDAIQLVDGLEELPHGLDLQQWRFVDLDGEGLSGLLTERGNAWFYKRNEGEGRFAPARRLGARPALALAGRGVQLRDVDGDGKLEALVLRDGVAGSYTRAPDTDGWGAFQSMEHVPTTRLDNPDAQLVDLDGDGIADLLKTEGDRLSWHRSEARDGFGPARDVVLPVHEDDGPRWLFSRDGAEFYLADMVGDGLSDVVRIRNGSVSYWPNLGYGRFGARIHMAGAPRFDADDRFDPARIRLSDVDGSGPTDLIYLGPDKVHLWFNQSGNGFSAATPIDAFPPVASPNQIQVSDLLGDGTACLVWSSPLLSEGARPIRYLKLMADGKPWLLKTLTNGLGRETRLTYTPSTAFYLADRRAGQPWATRLPYPVQCLSHVEQLDHITGWRFTTETAYHHGYFDGPEREFRGFGMVETWDTERFADFEGAGQAAPAIVESVDPVRTRTWFHTGAWSEHQTLTDAYAEEYWTEPQPSGAGPFPAPTLPEFSTVRAAREAARALRGKPLRVEVFADDETTEQAVPYSVTQTTWNVEELQPPQDSYGVYFVLPGETRTSHYERVADDPRVSSTLPLDIDDYGTVLLSAAVGYPRRSTHSPSTEQASTTVVVTEVDVVHQDTAPPTGQVDPPPTPYHLAVPVRQRTWEITGASGSDQTPWSVEDLVFLFSNQATEVDFENPGDGSSVEKRMLTEILTEYWDDTASTGLRLTPFGSDALGSIALPRQRFQLAYTSGLLTAFYGTSVSSADLQDAGYVDVHANGDWFIASGIQSHDDTRFYVADAVTDPFGNTTTATWDTHDLGIVGVTDPVGNSVSAVLDYHLLGPTEQTDANGQQTLIDTDALGRVTAMAVVGKAGEGDSLADPTVSFTYEQRKWELSSEPAYVHVQARKEHGHVLPTATTDDYLQSRTYSDGGGNVVQQMVQAANGDVPKRDTAGELVFVNDELQWEPSTDRWIGSGRVIVDNKGNPVKQYEPFFTEGPDYVLDRHLVEWGVSPTLNYDPLGRNWRTLMPDGTWSKVVFSPWFQETHDANDTAGTHWDAANPGTSPWDDARTQAGTSTEDARARTLTEAHWDTPTTARLDALGRVYATEAHNGPLNGSPDIHITTLTLDIQGNPLVVTDALGNLTQEQDFDALGRPLETRSLDAGDTLVFLDATGQPLHTWKSGDLEIRNTYDALRRPLSVEAKDGASASWVLHEYFLYGDALVPGGADATRIATDNLLGRLFRTYDGAGLAENASYDFKGNVLETVRTFAANATLVIDWAAASGGSRPTITFPNATTIAQYNTATINVLDAALAFTTTTVFDGLDRPVSQLSPKAPGTGGKRNTTEYTYDKGGKLFALDVVLRESTTPTAFVASITYDAQGRRQSIAYGNGSTTSYTYDPVSKRLTRILTQATGSPDLQDLTYTYDAVGNIVQINDGVSPTFYFSNAQVDPNQLFTYDPRYRLITATGREKVNLGQPDQSSPILGDVPQAGTNVLQTYTRTYAYDAVGNLLTMSDSNGWTRTYTYDFGNNDNNRLTSHNLPGTGTGNITYNARGAMTSMPHLTAIGRNYRDQIRTVTIGSQAGHYAYDSSGQRVRKAINNVREQTFYVGGWELYRRVSGSTIVEEQETLHVQDDHERVALVETATKHDTWTSLPHKKTLPYTVIRFQLSNHLGTAMVETDEDANVITYEEYHPYGTTAWQADKSGLTARAKRYRYTQKERDAWTGLSYHGARYYAPWLGRWEAADPAGLVDGPNRYTYASGRPTLHLDASGRAGELAWAFLKGAWKGSVSQAKGTFVDPVVSLKSDWNEVLAAESTGEALGIWASKTATNVKNMPGAVATGVTEGVRNLGEWGGHAATAQYYAATGDQEKALAFAEKAGESAGKVGTEAAIDAVGGKVLHTVATKGLPKIPTLPDAPQVPGSLAPAGGPGRIPDTQAPNANLASMGDKDKLAEMYPSEPPPGSAAAASKEGATTTFPTKEQAIADYLEETTGLKATPNPLEGVRGAGRQGDAFIAGIKHEFKTLDVGATNKTISNAVSRSLARGGQARNFVFDARGSGLSLDEARRGVYRASGGFPDQIDHITVIGDDYFWVGGPRR